MKINPDQPEGSLSDILDNNYIDLCENLEDSAESGKKSDSNKTTIQNNKKLTFNPQTHLKNPSQIIQKSPTNSKSPLYNGTLDSYIKNQNRVLSTKEMSAALLQESLSLTSVPLNPSTKNTPSPSSVPVPSPVPAAKRPSLSKTLSLESDSDDSIIEIDKSRTEPSNKPDRPNLVKNYKMVMGVYSTEE